MSNKNFLSVILATTMVLSIVACGNKQTSVENTNKTEAPVVETKNEVKSSVKIEILK